MINFSSLRLTIPFHSWIFSYQNRFETLVSESRFWLQREFALFVLQRESWLFLFLSRDLIFVARVSPFLCVWKKAELATNFLHMNDELVSGPLVRLAPEWTVVRTKNLSFSFFVCDVGRATEREKTNANFTVPLCFVLGVPSLCSLMWCRCCVDLSHFLSLNTITARCTHSQPPSHSDKNNSRWSVPSETGQSDTSITSAHLVAPSLHSRHRNFTFTLGSLIFQIREQFQNAGPEVAFTIWCSITKLNHGFGHGSNEISIASFKPTGEKTYCWSPCEMQQTCTCYTRKLRLWNGWIIVAHPMTLECMWKISKIAARTFLVKST